MSVISVGGNTLLINNYSTVVIRNDLRIHKTLDFEVDGLEQQWTFPIVQEKKAESVMGAASCSGLFPVSAVQTWCFHAHDEDSKWSAKMNECQKCKMERFLNKPL